MSQPGLADFLEGLARASHLVRVAAEVDPLLEVAEVSRRVRCQGGPSLLFARLKGHHTPVLTNLLIDEPRICRALEVDCLAEATQRIAAIVGQGGAAPWLEIISSGVAQGDLQRFLPRTARTAPCQQVVALGRDVNLGNLPAIQSWPQEAGPIITAARLFTKDRDSGRPYVGRHDLRVLDHCRLVACWETYEEPARLWRTYSGAKERMPVAAVLGGDPVGLLAAMAPVPWQSDVLWLAGLLRGRPMEMVKSRTLDLEVPADAEIVIEGFIDPGGALAETGPRGLPNGFCTLGQSGPVIQVTAVTHRVNPIYPTIVPGPPPDEYSAIFQALQRIMLPWVRLAVPDLVDYHFPWFGAARHWGLISIRKTYPGQARRVAHAIWGLRHLMFAKFLVIVDDTVDVQDTNQVWAAVATQADVASDLLLQQGPPDPCDPAAPLATPGWRLVIDATRKLPGEYEGQRLLPVAPDDVIQKLVSRRWNEYGLRAPTGG